MNFYKFFIVLFASLLFAANSPLSIFFISESVEGGQLVTIKNISANHQGNWRLALMGENAANFRINGQRANFEHFNNHYVQLPHSLSLGDEWDFMLTAEDLPAGQHSVELALWTTQGQPQHPFNGTILGRTTLHFEVEEAEKEPENEVKDEGGAEEKVPEPKTPGEIPENQPDEVPVIPEAEETPDDENTQLPDEADNDDNDPDDTITIPENDSQNQAQYEYQYQEQAQIIGQASSRTVAPIPQAAPLAPNIITAAESQTQPQGAPQRPAAIERNEPAEAFDEIITPPLFGAPSSALESDEDSALEEKTPEPQPSSPSHFQGIENPQTSDDEKLIFAILSFVGLLFSAMFFEIFKRKA